MSPKLVLGFILQFNRVCEYAQPGPLLLTLIRLWRVVNNKCAAIGESIRR